MTTHACVTPADQGNVAQILHFNVRDDVLNMGIQISAVIADMPPLAKGGQGRRGRSVAERPQANDHVPPRKAS